MLHPIRQPNFLHQPRKRCQKGKCRVLRRCVLPYPVLPLALPKAFKLLHSENKLLVSIRSFPWRIAALAGPGCGDAKKDSQLSRFWQTYLAPKRQVTSRPGSQTRPSGGDTLPRRCAGRTVQVRFSPIRSVAGGGSVPCTQVLICTGCSSPRYSSPTNN